MNSVYEYSDYRLFLKDYYEQRKAESPAFSYRYLAQKAGINSAPFFKFLIEGKRNLTSETVGKVAIALKLDAKSREYFENLVFFNQAKSTKDKNQFFDKLIALRKAQNIRRIGSEKYEYFSEWYHCAIRELVSIGNFRDDFAKLGNSLRPPISAIKAQESVDLLLQLGFLKHENKPTRCCPPVTASRTTMSSSSRSRCSAWTSRLSNGRWRRSVPCPR
jgi:uncharacterized protein (TIGR02147 family)